MTPQVYATAGRFTAVILAIVAHALNRDAATEGVETPGQPYPSRGDDVPSVAADPARRAFRSRQTITTIGSESSRNTDNTTAKKINRRSIFPTLISSYPATARIEADASAPTLVIVNVGLAGTPRRPNKLVATIGISFSSPEASRTITSVSI